jgi:hypothetical protein
MIKGFIWVVCAHGFFVELFVYGVSSGWVA